MSVSNYCYNQVRSSSHIAELSPLCIRHFKENSHNIFEKKLLSPWTKRTTFQKRSTFQEELIHYGIVQFKKENFVKKRDTDNTTIKTTKREKEKRKKLNYKELFKDPPQAKIMADGWPDKNIYDPAKDKMFWWRNDPVLNQYHEHWHLVMPSGEYNGTTKDREGENFIYMHRYMLARYDANRWCLGMPLVDPLNDYVHPIPEAFYPPPFLSQPIDGRPDGVRVPFPARPPNQVFRDIVTMAGGNTEIVISVKDLTYMLDELEIWIDGKTDQVHPFKLNLTDDEATSLGSDIEVVLHNIGHNMLAYIMHPYTLHDKHAYWIEIDKFKRTLGPYEKTVVSQRCDHAVGIRKPAQKTTKQMDETAITPWKKEKLDQFNLAQIAEKLFCDCGWPYNLIIPRGSKKGSTFKLFVYVSDGTNDFVSTDTQCGSTLLCGGEKWTDKVPDIKPFGYPFDRPFKDGSFYKTFQGMKNVAHTDITIKWVEDFPEV
ncbi:hypothetical protein GLOIN_2v1884737 [Rhizophagus irregularis DAOM 181602=DAOM 197198]|uniref:Di-copper centre-containing protein n=1 Tax=Rhizophagus irregularis (strain DAOM 181602 / DAOM 197198 / MUCL 43194) TaxID=747089 RepID=A0A2P4P363_RHIID|nr:hypothetical protein GLOIN_2v1884737 [Rhizophagus irregularis DAOM 181602=DAOM 197198]POG59836.1 hypothetical protein GLOIN_2v1884737 [Rhizophagus irregularis DAOM 181602=DAOM 197198]|eukprot:XP_025166702.1 hypothetical protein GLOIN_2v1884737 [Rhizophagus irregularis DAOM 181602=DAOM 197198]